MKLCECGCGGLAPIAKRTMGKRGFKKGEPQRFIRGHSSHVINRMMKGVLRIERDPETDCYEWQGTTIRGHGSLRFGNRHYYAHRYVYERFVGPIPTGAVMDHICRNRKCVNPDHLRITDAKGNVRTGSLAKLNPEAVKVIRHFRRKVPGRVIAGLYGMALSTIHGIQRGHSWKVLI